MRRTGPRPEDPEAWMLPSAAAEAAAHRGWFPARVTDERQSWGAAGWLSPSLACARLCALCTCVSHQHRAIRVHSFITWLTTHTRAHTHVHVQKQFILNAYLCHTEVMHTDKYNILTNVKYITNYWNKYGRLHIDYIKCTTNDIFYFWQTDTVYSFPWTSLWLCMW